jgi:hypothetical protein
MRNSLSLWPIGTRGWSESADRPEYRESEARIPRVRGPNTANPRVCPNDSYGQLIGICGNGRRRCRTRARRAGTEAGACARMTIYADWFSRRVRCVCISNHCVHWHVFFDTASPHLTSYIRTRRCVLIDRLGGFSYTTWVCTHIPASKPNGSENSDSFRPAGIHSR